MEHSLQGWDIRRSDEVDWIPWGSGDDARAKVLGVADGFHVVLVEADAGYRGGAHEHAHPEFFYLLDGEVQNQGEKMLNGDAYAAAVGSSHTDFVTLTPARYLTVFKV